MAGKVDATRIPSATETKKVNGYETSSLAAMDQGQSEGSSGRWPARCGSDGHLFLACTGQLRYLSNLGHRPLELAGMTISLPKTLIRENLAERFGYDRHHA